MNSPISISVSSVSVVKPPFSSLTSISSSKIASGLLVINCSQNLARLGFSGSCPRKSDIKENLLNLFTHLLSSSFKPAVSHQRLGSGGMLNPLGNLYLLGLFLASSKYFLNSSQVQLK